MRFISLPGLIPYDLASSLQRRLVNLRVIDAIPDSVLFLEHAPVITRGRGLQWSGAGGVRHMPLPQSLPAGVSFAESERGGDLTYHGPGQLVVYPICKLDGRGFAPARDVVGFIRRLEAVVIAALADFGVAACARPGSSGVWVGAHGNRKVASIGIAVRRWVTYHGVAINAVNDLRDFHLFSPCGFEAGVMTRLQDRVPLFSQWRRQLEGRLAEQFNALPPFSETARNKF